MKGTGMRLTRLIFLVSLLTGGPLSAEEYTFLPPEFYVGDAVDLVVTVPAERGRPSLPDTIPEHRWIEIRDLRIEESGRGYSVRIRFVCFAPEEVVFPRLDFGSIVIEDVPVSPAVLSGPEAELFGIQPPLLLPGTRLLILGAAAALILLPLGGLFLVPPLFEAVASRFESIRRRRSCLSARRALGVLREDAPGMPPKEVYDELDRIFRGLLSSLYSPDYISLTAWELRHRDDPNRLPDALTGLLIRAEHIRYGALPPSGSDEGRSDIDEGLRCLEEIRLGEAGDV